VQKNGQSRRLIFHTLFQVVNFGTTFSVSQEEFLGVLKNF
jgi:hypothetical protein